MNTAQQILQSDDFKRCEAFHGHVCGGLAIGYMAATAGLAWLKEKRALDDLYERDNAPWEIWKDRHAPGRPA